MRIYKISKTNIEASTDIQKEAGMRESFTIALMSALLAVMGGSAIGNAAKKFNVQESQVRATLENPTALNQVKSEMSNPETMNKVKQNMANAEEQKTQETVATNKISPLKQNIIARTLYAEGRNQNEEGLKAIASVIYNRSDKTPESMIRVIQKPKQFSCWNKASKSDWTNMKQGSGPMWEKSEAIAKSMLDGSFSPLGNWNHYYNPVTANPSWAYVAKGNLRPYKDIGNHRFMHISW